jgi:hypothetical protein
MKGRGSLDNTIQKPEKRKRKKKGKHRKDIREVITQYIQVVGPYCIGPPFSLQWLVLLFYDVGLSFVASAPP